MLEIKDFRKEPESPDIDELYLVAEINPEYETIDYYIAIWDGFGLRYLDHPTEIFAKDILGCTPLPEGLPEDFEEAAK